MASTAHTHDTRVKWPQLCCSSSSSCMLTRCRAALRVKIRTRLGRLGSTIQQCWVLLQDLHQLSVVQGGHSGRARARRMETLMRVSLQPLQAVVKQLVTSEHHTCSLCTSLLALLMEAAPPQHASSLEHEMYGSCTLLWQACLPC